MHYNIIENKNNAQGDNTLNSIFVNKGLESSQDGEGLKIGQLFQVWARYNPKIPTKFTNVVAFESMSKYRFPTS